MRCIPTVAVCVALNKARGTSRKCTAPFGWCKQRELALQLTVVHKVIHKCKRCVDDWSDVVFYTFVTSYRIDSGLKAWISQMDAQDTNKSLKIKITHCFNRVFYKYRMTTHSRIHQRNLSTVAQYPTSTEWNPSGSLRFFCSKFWAEWDDLWQLSLNLSTVFADGWGIDSGGSLIECLANIIRGYFLAIFWVFYAFWAWLTHKIVKAQNRRGIAWILGFSHLNLNVTHCFLSFLINV